MSRVSTYLNFPGNTEEAFLFYRSVFGGEFSGGGIQRFGDIPVDTEHPSLSDEDKKLILHIELPILGGHILMATDAPASMGFTVTTGNNMHINLVPGKKQKNCLKHSLQKVISPCPYKKCFGVAILEAVLINMESTGCLIVQKKYKSYK